MSEIWALRKRLIARAREKVREKYTGKEQHIIRAVNVLDDLDAIFNLLSEHLREWYAIHFPELDKIVKDNDRYLQLIVSVGERKKFSEKNSSKEIAAKAFSSMGSGVSEADLKQIQSLAAETLKIREERKKLNQFAEKEVSALMPNFSQLCGSLLAAKMLAEAGSFRRLALMPSSTIQVLGAEKALFSHIRKGTKPPKHGLLFQHLLVKKVPRKSKGKMARTLAGKLSIAIKEDFFGKTKIAAELQKGLEKRASELMK